MSWIFSPKERAVKIHNLLLILLAVLCLAGFAGTAQAADYYAEAKAAGYSDVYAAAYKKAKQEGEYDATAAAYARAKDSGRSDLYAFGYAEAIGKGHSHEYAAIYAEDLVLAYIYYRLAFDERTKNMDTKDLTEEQLLELIAFLGSETAFYDPYGGWQGFSPLAAFFAAQGAAQELVDNLHDPQADLAAEAERLKALEANLAAKQDAQVLALDARVWELLAGGQTGPGTSLASPNLNIVSLGDGLLKKAGNAGVEGNLQSSTGFVGTYSFNVNLFSGAISSGAMSGQAGSSQTFDLSGGMGSVNGNTFSVNSLRGAFLDGSTPYSASGSLSGTASKGFSSLGDIGASGTYNVRANGSDYGGAIVSGRRVR